MERATQVLNLLSGLFLTIAAVYIGIAFGDVIPNGAVLIGMAVCIVYFTLQVGVNEHGETDRHALAKPLCGTRQINP